MIDVFLKSVERQAYRIALIATSQPADALDLVQDAMVKLVENYLQKPEEQWKPLFYRILYNQIKDFHRKRSRHSRWFSWLAVEPDEGDEDPLHRYADPQAKDAENQLQLSGTFAELELALKELPLRQQQVFLLRAWEELSVAETALVMKCSEGSVKTHYFRALARLRSKLGEHWP